LFGRIVEVCLVELSKFVWSNCRSLFGRIVEVCLVELFFTSLI